MTQGTMWSSRNWKLVVALFAAFSCTWLGCGRGRSSQAVPSATPSAERRAAAAPLAEGAALYEKYCALCHGKDATGYAADNAPSLVSRSYLESASDEQIAAGIRMGRPGTAMAAYGALRAGPLNEQDIRRLVGFLRSKGPQRGALPPASTSGVPERGAKVFEQNCQACHGTPTTRGNAVHLHNPELLNSASPAFLRYAIVNGRPPTPMPSFQGKLDDQQIDDVVAWLWGFKPALPTPEVRQTEVPQDLPVVINPKGKAPAFTLREQRFVSVEQVKKALDEKRRLVIIDARPGSDWIQFHIPGAISAPYHDRAQLERVPNDGTWVIAYCACPHHASGEVVDALRAKKYANTAVMDEGILFWKDHGYPLVGEAVGPGGAAPSARPTRSAVPSARPAPTTPPSTRPAPSAAPPARPAPPP
jgi:mono/diheme cytochrome c family protein/rhodanese-related sulfurtransferase